MRNVVTILVACVSMILFVNCTDNSLEEIEQNKEHEDFIIENLQVIDTGNSGDLDDEEEEG